MSTQMTLFCATVHGQQNNNYYPNSAVITTAADLEAAAVWDHVAAGYAGGYRADKNFVTSDCVVMDVDNDHTDNPDEWVSPKDLPALIPGVTVATATSRNHMLPKGVLSARPRFHVYLPITPCSNAEQYAGLKKQLAARFEFFDRQALDAGRFIFGCPNPETMFTGGDQTVDVWLTAQQDAVQGSASICSGLLRDVLQPRQDLARPSEMECQAMRKSPEATGVREGLSHSTTHAA